LAVPWQALWAASMLTLPTTSLQYFWRPGKVRDADTYPDFKMSS